MSVLYVIEKHDQLLQLWRSQDAANIRIAHVDFHCDMRGLLIDRQTRRAYRIGSILRRVDVGNFLAHAVVEGRGEFLANAEIAGKKEQEEQPDDLKDEGQQVDEQEAGAAAQ